MQLVHCANISHFAFAETAGENRTPYFRVLTASPRYRGCSTFSGPLSSEVHAISCPAPLFVEVPFALATAALLHTLNSSGRLLKVGAKV